jgi:hypothetical protein
MSLVNSNDHDDNSHVSGILGVSWEPGRVRIPHLILVATLQGGVICLFLLMRKLRLKKCCKLAKWQRWELNLHLSLQKHKGL